MNIDNLLEKYWAADTSLKEEEQLQEYFLSDNVADEHQMYQSLFSLYGAEKNITLETEISAPGLISDTNTDNTSAKAQDRTRSKTKFFSLRNMGIAASLLVGIAILFNTYNDNSTKSNMVVVDDPQEALAYTMEALAMVSNSLNKGTKSVAIGMKPLNKTKIVIQ